MALFQQTEDVAEFQVFQAMFGINAPNGRIRHRQAACDVPADVHARAPRVIQTAIAVVYVWTAPDIQVGIFLYCGKKPPVPDKRGDESLNLGIAQNRAVPRKSGRREV